MAHPVLLDTCSALWLMGGEPMTETSREAIRSAHASNVGIYVSPFTAWEIGTLVAKQRLPLALSPEIWLESLLSQPGVRLAPLTPQILLASTALPGAPPSDPADRIIIATARLYGFQLITRDKRILQYAKHGHVLATSC